MKIWRKNLNANILQCVEGNLHLCCSVELYSTADLFFCPLSLIHSFCVCVLRLKLSLYHTFPLNPPPPLLFSPSAWPLPTATLLFPSSVWILLFLTTFAVQHAAFVGVPVAHLHHLHDLRLSVPLEYLQSVTPLVTVSCISSSCMVSPQCSIWTSTQASSSSLGWPSTSTIRMTKFHINVSTYYSLLIYNSLCDYIEHRTRSFLLFFL